MSMQHSRRRESGYLKVLGIGCLVIVVLLIVGGVVVVMNIKSIASSAAAAMIKNVVQESDLPAEQKDRIVKQVDRVTLAYKAGTISDDQLGTIMEKLGESALLPLGMVYAFEDKHITPSDMTADEKQAAKRSLQRFARGVFEETIDPWAVQEVFALVSTTDGQGNQQFKEQLTRQELFRRPRQPAVQGTTHATGVGRGPDGRRSQGRRSPGPGRAVRG